MQHLSTKPSFLWCTLAPAFLLTLAVSPSAWAEPEAVGRVVAVRGGATAVAADGGTRALHCDDPIFEGDRLETTESGGLGVLSGDVYTGLDERTRLAFGQTEGGTPQLDLEHGHLRVLDSESGNPARIVTPGLTASDAGTDTEALVFAEKAWTVSMLCTYDGPLDVKRGPDGSIARAFAGSCAVEKPREEIFITNASHPRLGVIDDDCGPVGLIGGTATDHFGSPADVALGPDVASAFLPSLIPPIDAGLDPQSIRKSCDIGGCQPKLQSSGGGSPPGSSPFPSVGPPGGS